jgi:hypothetical protein
MGNIRLIQDHDVSSRFKEETMSETHIDLGRFKSLSQILIDGLVADSGKQCHIANSDLLLLERFLPIRLDDSFTASARTRGKLSGGSRLGRLLSSSFRDSLCRFRNMGSQRWLSLFEGDLH